MEPEGQRASSNPSAILASIMSKREQLHEELRNIEKQIYDLETSYLQDSNLYGNVLKGFEGFLSSSKSTAKYRKGKTTSKDCMISHGHRSGYISLKRSRKLQPEDRLFSLSSVTSPAAEEHVSGRDDARSGFGHGLPKIGGTPANGQGKPKKGGRTAPKDAKRFRLSSEPDLDDEDDPDLTLR